MTLLDEKKAEIAARISELEPLVEEYGQLHEAAVALGITTNGVGAKPATKRGRGRPAAGAAKPTKAAASTGTGRRGRPKGSGNRAEEIIGIITITPGLTVAQIAGKLGIKPNYLYRVLPDMEKEGKVKKVDKGYQVA